MEVSPHDGHQDGRAAGLNLAWRWFLGYELDESIPDHSVLSKARKRYGVAVYERFFQQVVRMCEARGLVQGDVLFLDATTTKANAWSKSLRSRKLLEQMLPTPKQFVADLWLVNEPEVEPAPRPKKPRSGRPVNPDAKYLQSRSVTNDLRVSATDPDAELFRKLGETPILAHKTQMVVGGGSAAIITAVDVRPACEADSHAVGRMLDKHRAAVGRPARELVGDTGYGREVAFKECLVRGIQPTLRVRNLSNVHGGFTRDRFTYVPERDVFICPEGKEMRHFTDNFRQRQAIYKPRRGTCKGCPLKSQCAPGQGDRAVIRRWDIDIWEQVEQRPCESVWPGAASSPANRQRAHLCRREGQARTRQDSVSRPREDADPGAADGNHNECEATHSPASRSPMPGSRSG
jgi:Transposase domain (DUF772)